MKNTMGDLNNHLFAELERLSDEDLKGDDLQDEIERSKAVCDVAARIISNASLVLEAHKLKKFQLDQVDGDKLPKMLGDGSDT